MIIRLEEQRKLHAKAEKARIRTIRRYLRDISAALPCRPQQKHEILKNLKELAFSYPQKLSTRRELEEALGTPEEIAQTYIGENAVSLLKRASQKRRLIMLFAGTLLIISVLITLLYFSRPMVYYTENIEILESGTESVLLPQPYSPPQTAAARSGVKTVTCYDYRGTKLWTASVTGHFGYIYGHIGQIVDADTSITVYDKTGLTVRYKEQLITDAAVVSVTTDYNGITLLKKLFLSCDRFGTLS